MKQSNEVEISKIFPIQTVKDGVLINGNGDVTFSFELTYPEAFTLYYSDYNRIHEKMVNLIERLPAGSVIHQQDIYFSQKYQYDPSKITSISDKKDKEYFAFRPILEHKCYLHFTYSINEKVNLSYADNSYVRKRDFLFKNPIKDIDDKIEKAEQTKTLIVESIRQTRGLSLRELDSNEILELLERTWNLDFQTEKPKEVLNPVRVEKESLKIGDKFVGLVSLTGEGPKIASYNTPQIMDGRAFEEGIDNNNQIAINTSFTFPIALGLPTNHIVNTIIEKADNKKMISKLKAQKRSMNVFSGFGLTEAKHKKEEIDDFIEVIQGSNTSMCLTRQNVITWSQDEKEIRRKLTNIENVYGDINGYSGFIENFQTANLFIASLPGNVKANFRSLISTSGHSACLLPQETHIKGSDKGGIPFVDRFGKPFMLDLRNTPLIVNKNKLVFGGSGSGKSFWLNHYINHCIDLGYHIILMDKGGSFGDTIGAANGYYIDSSKRDELEFNIFLCPQDDNGNYLYSSVDSDGDGGDDKINFIIVILQKIWKQEEIVNNEENIQLRELITAYYTHVNEKRVFPSMNSFYEFIPYYEENILLDIDKKYIDLRALVNSLKPYVNNGEYSLLLNSDKRKSIYDYQVVGFDLEGIESNKMLYSIVSYIIIDLASNKIMGLPTSTPKVLLVDEAVDFLEGNTGKFVGDQARKIRKKGGELIIATQSVDFLDNVDPLIANSLLRNADTKILIGLGEESSALESARKFLSLTNQDIEIVKSLQSDKSKPYRENFIKLGGVPYVLRLEVSKYNAQLYSTDEKSTDKKAEYKKRAKGDIHQAIEQIIEDES